MSAATTSHDLALVAKRGADQTYFSELRARGMSESWAQNAVDKRRAELDAVERDADVEREQSRRGREQDVSSAQATVAARQALVARRNEVRAQVVEHATALARSLNEASIAFPWDDFMQQMTAALSESGVVRAPFAHKLFNDAS